MTAFLLSPCPPRFGKCVLLAKAAPAGHRRLALRKGIEPAIRCSLWISRAPGAIGACFVNKNREHTEQSCYDRDHAHCAPPVGWSIPLRLNSSRSLPFRSDCWIWARISSPPRASPSMKHAGLFLRFQLRFIRCNKRTNFGCHVRQFKPTALCTRSLGSAPGHRLRLPPFMRIPGAPF